MNIHKLRILITLIAVMTLVACGRQSKTWEQMDVAEEVMNAKPDSALAILNNIPVANISGEEEAAMQSFMRGREFCKEASDTLTMANLLVAQASI